MSRGLVLGLVLAHAVGAGTLQAQGGPPLETDDPGTPGAGHVELNIALAAERESGGTVYDAPRLDANLGVGERVQLKIEVPWRVATRPSESAKTDIGNLVIGVKWRFAESNEVTVSTYPQVALGGGASKAGATCAHISSHSR